MNVIYDQNAAFQKKIELDDARPQENRKARIHNALWAIPTISLVVLITILWVVAAVASKWFIDDMEVLVFTSLGLAGVLGFFAWGVLLCIWEPTYEPGENYTALVRYYLVTAGKTVLDHELISCQDSFWNDKKTYHLKVILENEDHTVSERELPYSFYIRTRTDVTETTVDLENRVVYTPYKANEGGKENA